MADVEKRTEQKRMLIALYEVYMALDAEGIICQVLNDKIRNQKLEMNPEDVSYIKEGLGIRN